jgi:hypothetical protein
VHAAGDEHLVPLIHITFSRRAVVHAVTVGPGTGLLMPTVRLPACGHFVLFSAPAYRRVASQRRRARMADVMKPANVLTVLRNTIGHIMASASVPPASPSNADAQQTEVQFHAYGAKHVARHHASSRYVRGTDCARENAPPDRSSSWSGLSDGGVHGFVSGAVFSQATAGNTPGPIRRWLVQPGERCADLAVMCAAGAEHVGWGSGERQAHGLDRHKIVGQLAACARLRASW